MEDGFEDEVLVKFSKAEKGDELYGENCSRTQFISSGVKRSDESANWMKDRHCTETSSSV